MPTNKLYKKLITDSYNALYIINTFDDRIKVTIESLGNIPQYNESVPIDKSLLLNSFNY